MMLSEKVTRCDMGVGCAEAGKCYAEEQGQPDRCWHYEDTAPTRSGVVDEAELREILAQECKAAGAWMGAADLRNNHSCDVPHNAAISAMRRVSKTDEGRNAISDGDVEAGAQALSDYLNRASVHMGGKKHAVAPHHKEYARIVLEAANLCGRNAVIEECALICDERAKDRASFTGQETLAERELDYEAEAALHGAAKAIRALTTTGGK